MKVNKAPSTGATITHVTLVAKWTSELTLLIQGIFIVLRFKKQTMKHKLMNNRWTTMVRRSDGGSQDRVYFGLVQRGADVREPLREVY